MYTERMAFT